MLIDETSIVTTVCNWSKSWSYRIEYLYQFIMFTWYDTGKKIVDTHTLVIITISSRGRLSCLIAFPRIISEWPFEYI